MPHMQVFYPAETKGQLYIPMVNNVMWVGCIIVVLLFQSSAHMEAAYGLAITITMLCTTLLLFFYPAQHPSREGLPLHLRGVLRGARGLLFHLVASPSSSTGGYFTIMLAALIMSIMVSWYNGSRGGASPGQPAAAAQLPGPA